ncbi:MAG TPA: hypothetical protein VN031_02545 [Candidatus Microsaccharimonas sp.]|nr:hypothetical protein [Candidatus Microsaccharimonas sp.]
MRLKTKRTNSEVVSWLLRIGLAACFLYAAIGAFREPSAWIYFVPHFTTKFVDAKVSLDAISVLQIAVAGWLLVGKYVRGAAALSVVLLAGIIIFNLNTLLITFRDFGLLCMAVALFFVEEQ